MRKKDNVMGLFLAGFLLLVGFVGGHTLYEQQTLIVENQKLKNVIVHVKTHARQQKQQEMKKMKEMKKRDERNLGLSMSGLNIKNLGRDAHDQ
jgi:regulator of replication initiation timing